MTVLRQMLVLALLAVVVITAGCGESANAPPTDSRCEASAEACVTVGVGAPIMIGSLLFSSDPGGYDTAASIRLAIDYVDGAFDATDGELLGHPVGLTAELESCTARSGRAGAHRLLSDPQILGVVGTTCSSSAYRAAAEVLSRRQVLMVSSSNTSPLLTANEGRERYYFRTAFNDLIQAAVVSEFARSKLRAATAATIAMKDTYSLSLADAFRTSFRTDQGRVVGAPVLSGDKADYTRIAARIAAARPGVIFVPLFDPACSEQVRALRAEPALATTPIVVSEACATPEFLTALGSEARGIYGSSPDYAEMATNVFYRTEFLPAFRNRFGTSPSSAFAASAFDAINLIFGAIRRVAVPLPGGALRVNRSDLRAAMLGVSNYKGLSGRLTCTPSGDCVPVARISIYRAPAWPVNGGRNVTPVFSTSRTLAEVTGSR